MALTTPKQLMDRYQYSTSNRISVSTAETKSTWGFPDESEAKERLKIDAEAINELQDALFAEGKRSLLVILQGIDTSGKDGTVRGVFNTSGPLGVSVTSFRKPTENELAHDYLWRSHAAVPRRGTIGIFNRSHYEDVLVVRVHGLATISDIEKRYEQINSFEKMLHENGTRILKFMLNISKEEQKERLEDRLKDPKKHWKFNPGDLADRAKWSEFMEAYQLMLDRCSTPHAPWHVIPSDRKWYRNAVIGRIVRGTLEEMNPQYPMADFDPKSIKIS